MYLKLTQYIYYHVLVCYVFGQNVQTMYMWIFYDLNNKKKILLFFYLTLLFGCCVTVSYRLPKGKKIISCFLHRNLNSHLNSVVKLAMMLFVYKHNLITAFLGKNMLLLVCMFYVHESTLTCAGIWYYWEKNWKKGAHQDVNSLFICVFSQWRLFIWELWWLHMVTSSPSLTTSSLSKTMALSIGFR